MNNPYGPLILALETALDGGSAAILENGELIDCAAGAVGLSKSEDILPIIENLLKKNGIKKKEIGMIGVSDGPGSLTGLRIGLAIAKGLGDALAAKIYKISILEALTYLTGFEGRVIAAVHSKRSGVFFREFLIKDGKRSVAGEIAQIAHLSDFVSKLESLCGENISYVLNGKHFLFPAESFEKNSILDKTRFFFAEGNLAEAIGLAIANANASDNNKDFLYD